MNEASNIQRVEASSIHARDLDLGYRAPQTLIAKGISFDLFPGELTCLMGPNGVGKSTLLKAILHQNPPLKGKVFLDQVDVSVLSNRQRAKKLAVVLTEKITSGEMTVNELVALGRVPHTGWSGLLSPRDKLMVKKVLDLTHISHLANKKLAALSDGQRQTALIARALAQDSKVLILDEPTAHLDLTNRFEIMHLLRHLAKKSSRAILVVTHDLEVAMETADKLWIMEARKPLLAGCPEDLMIQGQIQRLLPGDKWQIDPQSGKIRLLDPAKLPNIEGPSHLSQWIRNVFRKNPELYQPKQIRVRDQPFGISLFFPNREEKVTSIAEMIRFLRTQPT
ncbi:iron complex transport system ATP-binding protein [Cyclobacterium lianum]|uniref:Iron complex transport system ATP-binding protein n=1 Tax=Cyclobacterium lianum TaxID=388280 RepID=A0A1M7P8Q5_9BACT|nr:ABC transporter ATP-binding protein [Cyclobacterium lianum]SHN13150.1 iron complex transport system ATP-binding protein [Cyclobacterium lianum]